MTSFASEFGLQAPPSIESMVRFVPDQELWPPGPSWAYHGADLKKLRRYARPYLKEDGLHPFVQASQRAQARGLQMGIEHYRRRKAGGCHGLLVWQLNEPWPAFSWALIDHYGHTKPAYDMVKRLLFPVLVCLEIEPKAYEAGHEIRALVWIINDLEKEYEGCHLAVALKDAAGHVAASAAWELTVAANSAVPVREVSWTLPPAGAWRAECCLMHADQVLSTNEYDLATYDGQRPGWRQRLRNWLAELVVPG